MNQLRQLLLPLALLAAACGEEPDFGAKAQAITAQCTITVAGKGAKSMEDDYLPHVIACEHGSADKEALKAQAVAARTFAYYKLSRGATTVQDGTSDQVYTCGNKPSQRHFDAVKATSGQVLMYKGVVICSFFVAGAKPSNAQSCVAKAGDSDGSNTERYVTYNEGKTGTNITRSIIGNTSPTNNYNRGCQSQNGAQCLSLAGRNYVAIGRFYYGADIELVTAPGSCVTPQQPPTAPPPTAPKADAGVPSAPRADAGRSTTPRRDAGVPSSPRADAGLPAPTTPGAQDPTELPPADPLGSNDGLTAAEELTLQGGCATVPLPSGEEGSLAAWLALALVGVRVRRSRRPLPPR